jgi:hypothetical protein
MAALLSLAVTGDAQPTYGNMRNGSLNTPLRRKADEPGIAEAIRAGWKLPDDMTWPGDWNPNPATPNGTLEYVRDGGPDSSPAVRLDGEAHIASYFGPTEPGRPYVASVRVKGHGKLWYGAYTYSATTFLTGRAFIERQVDTDSWREYRAIFPNGRAEVVSINPAVAATGGLLVDDLGLVPADPADVEMIREENALYGTGALVEDLGVQAVSTDAAFARSLADYRKALAHFRARRDAAPRALAEALEAKAVALEPYVAAGGQTVISRAYNDMVLLTRVTARLLGEEAPTGGAPGTAESPAGGYRPGVRPPRPDAVTITDIHSNKVLYEENETATTRVSMVNTSGRSCAGTLVANMHLDIETTREIARAPFGVQPGQTGEWGFTYSVGPETYGRGIEVRFLDETGALVDTWQEFYAVAAEFFRVQQHSHDVSNSLYDVTPWVDYYNEGHYFANEPTDFGVSTVEAEQYLSGQAGYMINQAGRQAQIDHYRTMGIRQTFYQTFAFCGPAGYEEMRKHPEYVLYDENGQPAVDPIYGGYPNPMELASPLEMGPKRAPGKSYLDRRYTPWQHCAADLASEEVVRYQTQRIQQYALEHHFDGVYIDGNMGVLAGYGYDGKPNVPSGKEEDFARLSARNHRIFSDELKRENPNFGTWYNWSYPGLEWARSVGLTAALGSGGPGETTDENIRAATGYRNVMLLMETGSFLQMKEGVWSKPAEFLRLLCDQRDFAVQKYGASSIIGYSFIPWKAEEPGPAKWAWPTMGYLGAQLIATQTHHAGGFYPSMRPWLQFQERYSSLLWAPDVRVVPDEEGLVQVSAPEDLWWKRLAYRRETPEGYDLIVHLVRIPPTEHWDYSWPSEPEPLAGAKVSVALTEGIVERAWAARPYHFEEDQQPVQVGLTPSQAGGKVSVEVSPFRYGTMVVLRVRAQ